MLDFGPGDGFCEDMSDEAFGEADIVVCGSCSAAGLSDNASASDSDALAPGAPISRLLPVEEPGIYTSSLSDFIYPPVTFP